jgi:hypothetical protein
MSGLLPCKLSKTCLSKGVVSNHSAHVSPLNILFTNHIHIDSIYKWVTCCWNQVASVFRVNTFYVVIFH